MTHQHSFFHRPRLWGILCGLTLAVAQFFSPAGVGIAQAAPVCTTGGNVVTCTYSYTGAAETFTVPAGVSSVRIVALGAAGAAGDQNFPTDALGGRGAEVSANLAVSPNQSLVLVVGGAPTTTGDCYPNVRCIGGFNGGGTSHFGGGGGGASDVRVGGNGLAQRVLVAAGGGGGGNSFDCDGLVAGGNGGSAGQAGSAGAGCRGIGGGSGGQPGSQSAGGAGGVPYGGNGTLGTGGNGGGNTGGGGGGGYYGGGGGGDLEITPDFQELTASGGGGGGSNLVPNGGTARITTQPAAIIVSYTLPDSTPPAITPTVNGTLGNNGWYFSNVTVSWTVVDNESTISSQSGCGTQNITSDTAGVIFTCSATSAGGTASQSVTIKRDATSPVVTVTGVTAGASYTLGSVPVAACSTTDALSGVATQATLSITGGNPDGTGNFTASCNGAVDNAGNSRSVAVGYTVTPPPDSTAPVISPNVVGTLGNNGWYVSDVTVSWSVVDNESTPSLSGCEIQNITSDMAGVTFTCSATSAGGTSSQSVTINRDATPPTITLVNRTAANNNGWNNSDVTVNWSCSDATSGVVAASVSQTVSNEGANQTASGSCSDNAGNSAGNSQNGINIDKTAPTISAAVTTQPNGNGWYNSNVTVHFTCADALSGVICPTDQVLSSEGSAVASTAQTVTDLAGNTSAPSNVVTVKIDKTAPVVTVTGVSNNATYTLGSVPVAGCSTTDALSGVATQATLNVSGGNPDGTGSFIATCSGATDNAGNSGSSSATYSVLYNWSGFLQPVDNLPTVNTVNAGQSIPVKFSLGGNFGLNIFAAGYPKVQTMNCGSSGGGSSDPIEETVTAGNSSLQYNATTQTYTYVWKTDKSWGGTCRQLIVKLIDGSEHIALFQFNGKARSASESSEGEVVVGQQIFLPLVNR